MAHERNCIVCGEEYRYCPHCASFRGLPKWKAMFDTDVCHDVFNIVSGYNTGSISPEDAKAKLSAIDLSGKTFKENIQETIDKILGAESAKRAETVADEQVAESESEEGKATEPVEEKPVDNNEEKADVAEPVEAFAKSATFSAPVVDAGEKMPSVHHVRRKKAAAENENTETAEDMNKDENDECE